MIFIETSEFLFACDINLLAEKVLRSMNVIGYSLVAERQLRSAKRALRRAGQTGPPNVREASVG